MGEREAEDDSTPSPSGESKGGAEQRDELFRLVYAELHALATASMQRQRRGHTLQPTALVNEAYLRLVRGGDIEWVDRTHFFAVAAKCIRQVLIDHARGLNTHKRGGGIEHVSLSETLAPPEQQRDVEILLLDEALERLDQFDPRWARVIELRFFGGLTAAETAEALSVSVRTVQRDWRFARAWLFSQLNPKGQG
ncbi:MAG TPA: sigma-70 family RNA polymerase sigma factor [Planctomycetes bacterium]|nr:sigma-70 family RNA polymerase sigma factor [Planctomycetota bacterium]